MYHYVGTRFPAWPTPMPFPSEPPPLRPRPRLGGMLAVLLLAGCARLGEDDAATRAALVPQKEPQLTASSSAPAPIAPASSAARSPLTPAMAAPAATTASADTAAPRLGSIGRTTWIYASPKRKTVIGYLRAGTAVTLASAEPVSASGALPSPGNAGTTTGASDKPAEQRAPKRPRAVGGCASGRWFAARPSGYICEDDTTTFDLDGDLFRALAARAPRARPAAEEAEDPLPLRYAFSMGAPMYGRAPSAYEQRHTERGLPNVPSLEKLPRVATGHEDLDLIAPIPASDPLPAFLAPGSAPPLPVGQREGLVRKLVPYGSMIAYADAFTLGGRAFVLTPELALVPADRLRPFHRSSFHGVAVGPDLALPLGWIRRAGRPMFRREASGAMALAGQRFAPRSVVALAGEHVEVDGVTYEALREGGLFVRAADVSVVRAPDKLPAGIGEDDKWIEASLGRGTLTLFVGRAAAWSTLMSPGKGGVTRSSALTVDELVKGAFTPLGTYRIENKQRAALMTPEDRAEPEQFWIADVPYTQYFRPPFAIHTTYWHEDFGLPKSGGCINLSPLDAARVFAWTDPQVPEDWAARFSERGARGTTIVITR
jgi:L,D-transpeptidase catalytic domain